MSTETRAQSYRSSRRERGRKEGALSSRKEKEEEEEGKAGIRIGGGGGRQLLVSDPSEREPGWNILGYFGKVHSL